MRKRKKSMNETERVLARVENFIVSVRGDGEYNYVRVREVGAGWSMAFRDDTFKYAWILMLAAEEKYHRILLSWIVAAYHTAMCAPDPEFLEDIIAALGRLGDRSAERALKEESDTESATDKTESEERSE